MESTSNSPLAFFDNYLQKEIYDNLKNFYNLKDNFLVQDGLLTAEFDKENHIIIFTNIGMVDKLPNTFKKDFNTSIKSRLDAELTKAILFIEQGFEKRFSEKKEVRAYQEFLKIKVNSISKNKAIEDFLFLNDYLEKINKVIGNYSIQTTNYQFTPSFNLLAENEEEQTILIDKLYLMLTETPSMINSNKEEFINAFTGKEVAKGIDWLVKGKNKSISKVSLFYLINELINQDFLSRSILNDLNKYIRYVFRDDKGSELKNLKQSKATFSKSLTAKERIDTIISSL